MFFRSERISGVISARAVIRKSSPSIVYTAGDNSRDAPAGPDPDLETGSAYYRILKNKKEQYGSVCINREPYQIWNHFQSPTCSSKV